MENPTGTGAAMKTAKRLGLLLDLVLLAASITTGGPIVPQVQAIAVIVAAAIGGLAIFCAVVLTVAVVQQKQPPFPMQGPGGNPWLSS
jgi:hypothetical protein